MERTERAASNAVTPHLHRLSDFETVLRTYRLSPEAHATLRATRFALLIGPSSSGRNTIIRKLLETGKYHFIISDTTRPPRSNNGVLEQNGVEYWFRSEDDMLADLQAGKFLEAEIIHKQQVSGVSIRELERAHAEQRIAITDIDIGGVQNVVRLKPDTEVIFILPPSFEEWQRRTQQRGHMSAVEWHRRLETAARIFSAPRQHDYFKVVVNDNLTAAVEQVDRIARTGQTDPAEQARGLKLAEELFAATESLL